MFLDQLFRSSPKVSDDELAYYRDHPLEIDQVTAPGSLRKGFLVLGFCLGACFVGLSKAMKQYDWLAVLNPAFRDSLVDIVYEIGAALIGAAIVTYVLVLVLREQQAVARKWRAELRQKLRSELEGGETQ